MGNVSGVDLGTFGVWTFDFEVQPAALMRQSVQELEELGWQAFWIPELLGREAFSHAGYLLSVTERIRVINGIAQIWSRGAFWAQGASTLLADAYPGRYVLGLGFGGSERPGTAPMAAMTAYLNELDAATSPNPAPKNPAPRILAAYGPKMLALARDRAAGAHCYKVSVAHTAQAREIMGPGAFLGVEHAVLFETDPARARAVARAHLAAYLAGQYNAAKFRRLGYTEQDLSDGGSDRFVDDFVFWGDLDTIVAKLKAHVDAGADHVAIQVIGINPGQTAMPYWRMLSDALLPQRVSALPPRTATRDRAPAVVSRYIYAGGSGRLASHRSRRNARSQVLSLPQGTAMRMVSAMTARTAISVRARMVPTSRLKMARPASAPRPTPTRPRERRACASFACGSPQAGLAAD